MKVKIEVCGYKMVPAGLRGMVQGHTERYHGGIKYSAVLLSPWVYCHVAVSSDIMSGMCCTNRQDTLGGLEHTRK